MNIKQKALKAIVWSAIQNWGSQAGSLLVFFVLARLLSPKDFGLVALANVFLAFMQIFLSEGFAKALIQRKQLDKAHLDTTFWLNLGFGLILCSITLFSANWIGNFFKEPNLAPILRGFSVLFIIASFSTVQQAVLERQFAFKAIALRSLIGVMISGIVGIGMALAGFGVWSLVSQQITYELVAVIVLWRLSDWRPSFQVSLTHFKDLWHFGITTLGFNFLSFCSTRGDDLLIGYYIDATALGYYSLAYKILTIMTQLLVSTSNQVALPIFSRLQDDLAQFRRVFYRATQFTSLIAFPTFLGVVILAPEAISVIFGEKWLPSVPVLQILAFEGIRRSVSFFKSSVLLAMDKPHWRLNFSLINAILNIIAFAIAVRWGIIAVAFAYVIRGYLMFPVGQWMVSLLIHTPILTYLRQFLAPLGSAILMMLSMAILKGWLPQSIQPYLTILICSLGGIGVYGLSIRLFAPELFQQLQEFLRLTLAKSSPEKA